MDSNYNVVDNIGTICGLVYEFIMIIIYRRIQLYTMWYTHGMLTKW